MDLNQYKTDKKLELAGVWLPVDDKTQLLIARAGNQNYINALKKIIDDNGLKFAASAGKISHETMLGFVKKAVSQTILLGWKGLTKAGKPVEYSAESALQMFIDFPDFFNEVLRLADNIENFQSKAEEEIIKN